MDFPFTQEHLAATAGFSLAHTNKTLKRLRASGLFKWNAASFEMVDEERMTEFVGRPRRTRWCGHSFEAPLR